MDRLRALAVAVQAAVPTNFWEWASASFSIGDVVSSSGLVTIVALLYTGRLVPVGQHRRELEQQKVYYEGRLQEAREAAAGRLQEAREAAAAAARTAQEYFDGRLTEISESRDYYRDARLEEKTRGDKLTDAMMEQVELTKTAVKVLTSVDEAAAAKGA